MTSSREPAPDRRRRVFIIDDDPALVALLSDLFRMEGCDVYTAGDGLQAIQLLNGGISPDLIFLDMHMEGADGWDFHSRLQELGIHIPIVVATGDPDPQKCAEEIGAVGYLAKPFDLRDLDHVLEHLVVTGTRISHSKDPAA